MDKMDQVRTMLKNVVDPELGLNIIDLGLVYDLKIEEDKCYVLITFTTMGCPVSGAIVNDIYTVLEPLGFADIKVDITYNPPWTPDKLSPEGKQRLGYRA